MRERIKCENHGHNPLSATQRLLIKRYNMRISTMITEVFLKFSSILGPSEREIECGRRYWTLAVH
jgi:hypothetical protein